MLCSALSLLATQFVCPDIILKNKVHQVIIIITKCIIFSCVKYQFTGKESTVSALIKGLHPPQKQPFFPCDDDHEDDAAIRQN